MTHQHFPVRMYRISILLALVLAASGVSFARAQEGEKKPAARENKEAKKDAKKDGAKQDAPAAKEKDQKKDASAEEKGKGEKAPAAKEGADAKTEKKTAEDGKEGEKGESSANDAEKKAETEKKKKPRPPPLFYTQDGNRISGVPDLESLTVKTAYGELVVPKDDLVRVRFAREKDPKLQEKIAAEIDRLKSEEFEIREEATKNLRDFGAPALKQLHKATKSDDEEVKNRAQTLIKAIEEEEDLDEAPEDENAEPIRGDDDEVVTVSFVIRGKVKERDFDVKSSYGSFRIDRKDIISIVFQEFSPTDAEFLVPGSFFAPQNKWYESKIAVSKGDRLQIDARGSIQLHNYGWTVGPEGTTHIGGNHFQNFPVAALVGRIGKKGKPFLVGAAYRGKANSSGKIQFSVAYRGGTVSGSFNVKVQLKRLEEEGEAE